MHRNLGWTFLLMLAAGLTTFAQQPVASPSTTQATPAGTQRPRPPQPQSSNQQSPLTNADVIKMVKGGVPESAIISSIQSSPAKFDLSAAGLAGLQRSGVSQKTIDAMMAKGIENLTTSSGAQTSANKSPGKRGTAQVTKIKLAPPKTGPQVKNSRAIQANAATIAALQRQRQAADLEAAQMKVGVRPASQTNLPPGQTQSASSSTDGTKAPPKSQPSGSRASTATAITAQKTEPQGLTGPSKAYDSQGNSLSSLARVAQPPSMMLACAHDPTMRIATVSGESTPGTFTPEMQYNFYTITGCSFGDPGPTSKVYIYYQDLFHQEFQIQEWNDNGIKLNLDPNLKGVLDQDNLTLVVQRADGKQATKSGFKFFAARETTRLSYVPKSDFSLYGFTLNNTSNLSSQYTSPSAASVVPNIGGWTSEVQWAANDPFATKMDPGEDIYSLSRMQPGFSPDSAQMSWVNLQCGDYQFVNLGGDFGLKWVGDDLHASWQAQYCKPVNCGGAFQADCFVGPPSSSYAVDVWVTGPRGVDPWTGKPH